jgi:hypothetical protein
MEPQRPLSGFTHWIPSPEDVSGGANRLILRKHSAVRQRKSRIHLRNPG